MNLGIVAFCRLMRVAPLPQTPAELARAGSAAIENRAKVLGLRKRVSAERQLTGDGRKPLIQPHFHSTLRKQERGPQTSESLG